MNKVMKSFAFILVLTVMTGPALACGWHGGGVWGGFNPAGAERKPYNPSSEEEEVTVVTMYKYNFCPAQITVPPRASTR